MFCCHWISFFLHTSVQVHTFPHWGEAQTPILSLLCALLVLHSVAWSYTPSRECLGSTMLTPAEASSPSLILFPWCHLLFPRVLLSTISFLWLAEHRPSWDCPAFYSLSSTYSLLALNTKGALPSSHAILWRISSPIIAPQHLVLILKFLQAGLIFECSRQPKIITLWYCS